MPSPEGGPATSTWRWKVAPLGPDLLAVALGCLWLGDAVLQLQPQMFTSAFPGQVLYSAALMYQPPGLSNFLLAVARVEAAHLWGTTILIATFQVLIGGALLFPRTRRRALVASAAWAAVIWVLGEGLGFLATGTASLWSGAPGAALLYLALSLLALVGMRDGRRFWPAAAWIWTLYWGLGALLNLPWRYPPGAVMAYNLQTAAQSAPGVIREVDFRLAQRAFAFGWPVALAFIALELLLAAAVWSPRLGRPALALGLLLDGAFWILGQGLGGVLVGTATDFNSGPLVALLGLVLLTQLPKRAPRSLHPPASPGAGAKKRDPAMTYSPTPLPGQYHRR